MAALVRIVDSATRKELGRWTGKGFFSDRTDPTAQAGNSNSFSKVSLNRSLTEVQHCLIGAESA